MEGKVGEGQEGSGLTGSRRPASLTQSVVAMPRWRRVLLALLVAAAWLGPALLPAPPPPAPTTPPPSPRVIVAYSLESQVQMEQRVPVPCSPPPPPPRAAPAWQQTARHAHLYSAHYDVRLPTHHYVRIVAMLEGHDNGSFFCQVWFGGQPLVMEALEADMWVSSWDREDPASLYRPVLLSCPIPRERSVLGDWPSGVSVARKPCDVARSMLVIAPPPSHPPRDFAVCVKGMDFPREDISRRLVEWLELNRLLGADEFFMYVYGVHPNIKKVLDRYSRAGVVKVVPLKLPGKQPNSPAGRSRFLRTHLWQKRRNEVVPYNDCFYRNLYAHRYVLPLDVDEVIVPTSGRTWRDVLAGLEPRLLDGFASLSVRNAYFFDDFPSESASRFPAHMHVLRHTTRSANFSPADEAVKSFVSTRWSLTVFNHYALRTVDPAVGRSVVLDTAVAQLNHYKASCSPLMVHDCHSNFLKYRVDDGVVLRFADELMARVDPVLRELGLLPR
ncbi:hypothetical protein PR048_002816 [Dryococelus australis]|uniref:Glycosyltransferase family 92 protein n=1 Tax=Dryococelus australis TaxID=614101 RepID=A0ABQ9IL79_9NEOP|nr:hypothetical protein PR048_002816 [Dryococelus australis]